MTAASLTHPTVGQVLFLAASTQSGWPIDTATAMEEELSSSGVDGKRWRTNSLQETEIQMTTVKDCQTFALAITEAQKYLQCKTGAPVTVVVTMAGTTYRYRNVHVVDVQPQPLPGAVVGTDATAGNAAHVIAQWRLILMDTTKAGEAG